MEFPRVSLAVVAFNQQHFVGEAIAAAFAQDYPNLQIILSDDASTDDTFAVMQAAAGAYRGGHDILLNRTIGGQGILAHLLSAADRADGELFVGAAGDDMSAPNRVSSLVEAWRPEKPDIIHSAWVNVDMSGRYLSGGGHEPGQSWDSKRYFPDRQNIMPTLGCTTAYSLSFLRNIRRPTFSVWLEDYYIWFIAVATGRSIKYIDQPLVKYRRNAQAVRNFVGQDVNPLAYEEGEAKYFSRLAPLLRNLVEALSFETVRINIDLAAIESDLTWYAYRASWMELGAADRLRATLRFRTPHRLRWSLPRVVGARRFVQLKRWARRIRR